MKLVQPSIIHESVRFVMSDDCSAVYGVVGLARDVKVIEPSLDVEDQETRWVFLASNEEGTVILAPTMEDALAPAYRRLS